MRHSEAFQPFIPPMHMRSYDLIDSHRLNGINAFPNLLAFAYALHYQLRTHLLGHYVFRT